MVVMAENKVLNPDINAGELHQRMHRGNFRIRENVEKIFDKMSTLEFMMLRMITKMIDETEEKDRIYLKDVAERLKLQIPDVSKMAQKLSDKGLIIWTHDPAGEGGTYIQITPAGSKAAEEQQKTLNKFYGSVINRFGGKKFEDLLQMMDELGNIMEEEAGKL